VNGGPELRVNAKRLWDSLIDHARIGGTPEGGINRQALTEPDRQSRDLFAQWCRAEGMEVATDQLGNMFATLPGSDPSLNALAAGSHLDTQATGGKFDGVLGVLGGLEVARTLRQSGLKLRHPFTVINWTAEEGGRFEPSMAASGIYAGVFSLADAATWHDAEGVKFLDALQSIGYAGNEPIGKRRFSALIELHIEQGPVLDQSGDEIGVVTGAQGMSFNTVTITGRASHAGTTPMESRLDPVGAFLRIAASCQMAAEAIPDSRFTVGVIKTWPGSHSVIPKTLTFSLDLRHPKAERLRALFDAYAKAAAAEQQRGFTVHLQENASSPVFPFDTRCVSAVRHAVQECGYRWRDMVSGAGHDSIYAGRVMPAAMIFVPCRNGISHNPAESITPHEAEAGANVLLQTLLKLDRPDWPDHSTQNSKG
jgi:N-carbamoyl-L-amino-acid hydrolase